MKILKYYSYFKFYLNKIFAAPRFKPLKKRFLNHTLHIHDIASYDLCINEIFESEVYKFICRNPKPLIIDCGANMGLSVIYFKTHYPDAQIIAFEADPHIFSFLKKNMSSFNFRDVILINKAVWNSSGYVTFNAEGGAGGRIEESIEENISFKKIEATRLRDYLESGSVDFLKIDIEGAEYEVLDDCKDLITKIDYIFIEYHSMQGKAQNLDLILNILSTAGFRYHIKDAFTRRYPFVDGETNFGMDLQLNIFAINSSVKI